MLKIGVLGVGHLGKIHLKCIQLLKDTYELVGFYDPNEQNAQRAIEQYQIKRFDDLDALVKAVDVIDIVTPTTTHFQLAKFVIGKGKHVFIEKPLTHTLEEAYALKELANNHDIKIQVGHVERFNPALLALESTTIQPLFIEAHRLATFNPRGTDVSVVLDLMIHDLDIVLDMVDANIEKVSASGVAIVSPTSDICNARIEFDNGCVANITASRLSMKQMRKIRLFQRDAYISLDFLEKKTEIVKISDVDEAQPPAMTIQTASGKKAIQINMPQIQPVNAIKLELETFADCILQNKTPKVTIEDGYKALELAYQIMEDIERRNLKLQ